jgi:hypothetical protein
MFTVTITDETAESIFRDILIQDYRGLKSQIRENESRLQDLKSYELEDLAADRRWATAIETLFEYYLTDDRAKKIIDEENDRAS